MKNKDVLEEFKNLKITNQWLFPKVFGDPDNVDLSKELIQRCIGRKIESIHLLPIPESSNTPVYGSHGVRFDVKFIGDDKIYIVEMQNYNDALIKRANYEAAVEMIDSFDPGKSYNDIQDVYVIYICTFDYFGRGKARYVVKQFVQDLFDLNVDTNLSIIILNTTARSEEKELDALMRYFNESSTEDHFTKELEDKVRQIKENQIARGDFMTLDDVIRLERKDEREKVTEEVTKQVTEEVRKSDAIEFCKKMLSQNLDVETIVKCTDLTKEEILEIEKQM